MKSSSLIALATTILLLAKGAAAIEHEQEIRNIMPEIQSAVLQQDVFDTLRAHNMRRTDLSQSEIDRMESVWQSELNMPDRPMISGVVDNELAVRMRHVAEANSVEDIVVIDVHGLSIAQSTAGAEVWLGEDPHFVKTVRAGTDAVFVEEVKFNEPTQSYQSRASFAVVDPDTGEPIGAITIGFNVDAL